MANLIEIRDGGPNPNTPSVEEMRDSQHRGSEAIGLNEQSYGKDQSDFNRQGAFDGEGTAPLDEASEYRAGLPFLGRK